MGNNEKLTSEVFGSLGKMTTLMHLNLKNSDNDKFLLTDPDVKKLLPLTELVGLSFDPKNLTDQGLMTLAGLKSLKELTIRGPSKITPVGLQKLRDAVPMLKIDRE